MGIKSGGAKMKAAIKAVAAHLPENEVLNQDLLNRIKFDSPAIHNGSLERLLGIKQRYFAAAETQVSDLASAAARTILNQHPDIQVDLLLFAAASSDLIEPATANIIQSKLGLECPIMDIKNACSSFASAMQVASAFIENDTYQNVLIVNGEKLSEVINYNPKDDDHLNRCLASYGLGDAGAAMLLGQSNTGHIVYQKFQSWGEYWPLCTVEGGGSMHFRNPEKYYFESDARALRQVFMDKLPDFVRACFDEAGWHLDDLDCLISHQVSNSTISDIAQSLGIPDTKCINTFQRYGNIAAATIPVALHQAMSEGKIMGGDKVCLLGLAAGVSLSVQLIEW